MRIDLDGLDKAAVYRLLISAIVPRPIAWIGSVAGDGSDNLAPFSFFMGVGSDPPMIAVSVSRARDGGLKHTARNVLETEEFSVSLPEEPQLDAMHATSAAWEESEFDAVGIARAPCARIRAPRVADARVAMECRLAHAVDLGGTHLLVGEVLVAHVSDALLRDGVVDIAGYRPVARLGGDLYTTLGTVLARPRAKTTR